MDTFAGKLIEDKETAALVTKNFAPGLAALRDAGVRDLYVLARLEDFLPTGRSLPSGVATLAPGADAAAVGRLLCGKGDVQLPFAWPACATVRGVVFAGSNEAVQALGGLKPVERPEFAEALAATKDSAAEIVAMPSADARRVLEEMIPNLPAEIGGGPVTILTRGIRWATLSLRNEADPGFRLTLQSRDAAAAKSIVQLGKGLDQMLRRSPSVARFVSDYGKLADRFTTTVEADRITVKADAQAAGVWATSMAKSARQGAVRSQCMNNLKQIGLAMHNYLDVHGTFPPAFVADKEGKPLLSWRVLILPFVEQQALYNEFHLDEPWDGPHNKPLIERMPAVYACRSDLDARLVPGKTTYLTPRGPRTIFPGAVGVKIKGITDGTSNTIMTLDGPGEQAVVWTKPDDWDAPGEVEPRKLLSRHQRGSNVGFADGSVRFLIETINKLTLRALFTRDGGEVISNDAL